MSPYQPLFPEKPPPGNLRASLPERPVPGLKSFRFIRNRERILEEIRQRIADGIQDSEFFPSAFPPRQVPTGEMTRFSLSAEIFPEIRDFFSENTDFSIFSAVQPEAQFLKKNLPSAYRAASLRARRDRPRHSQACLRPVQTHQKAQDKLFRTVVIKSHSGRRNRKNRKAETALPSFSGPENPLQSRTAPAYQ